MSKEKIEVKEIGYEAVNGGCLCCAQNNAHGADGVKNVMALLSVLAADKLMKALLNISATEMALEQANISNQHLEDEKQLLEEQLRGADITPITEKLLWEDHI